MRVKCLAQEHNTMSPARARTRTARSGVERTNHEATAPPTYMVIRCNKFPILTGLLERVTAPPDPNCTTIQYGPDTSGTLRSLIDEHTKVKACLTAQMKNSLLAYIPLPETKISRILPRKISRKEKLVLR